MRAAEQVPLLLQMKEERIALVKAIDSGDTDLGERLQPPTSCVADDTSVPRLAPSAIDPDAWRLLPHTRRLGLLKLDPSYQTLASLRATGRPAVTEGLLLSR